MAVVDVYNLQNEKVSELELKDEVFAVPVLRCEVVREQALAAKRHGQGESGRRSFPYKAGRRQGFRARASKIYRQGSKESKKGCFAHGPE